MKILLLIPSVLKQGIDAAVAEDRHPRMDYFALRDALSAAGCQVELQDYAAVEREGLLLVWLARRFAGRAAALALIGFLKRRRYDVLFTNGENVGIPLALMLKGVRKRPGHVTIGHRLSTGKKRLFFQRLRADRQMDTIFVYARTQWEYARETLKIPETRLCLIAFHADTQFYRPFPDSLMTGDQICAAGLEWRDYKTLIQAVADMPDLSVRLAASSPWSRHTNETEGYTLPSHVDARRYEYDALRELYASSLFVVVPLYENDFQAGITTILEGMAMGKPVVVTRTEGQTDVIEEGKNGLYVAPGDVEGWRSAIQRLRHDADLRRMLGQNALQWVEERATLEQWTAHLVAAIKAAGESRK